MLRMDQIDFPPSPFRALGLQVSAFGYLAVAVVRHLLRLERTGAARAAARQATLAEMWIWWALTELTRALAWHGCRSRPANARRRERPGRNRLSALFAVFAHSDRARHLPPVRKFWRAGGDTCSPACAKGRARPCHSRAAARRTCPRSLVSRRIFLMFFPSHASPVIASKLQWLRHLEAKVLQSAIARPIHAILRLHDQGADP